MQNTKISWCDMIDCTGCVNNDPNEESHKDENGDYFRDCGKYDFVSCPGCENGLDNNNSHRDGDGKYYSDCTIRQDEDAKDILNESDIPLVEMAFRLPSNYVINDRILHKMGNIENNIWNMYRVKLIIKFSSKFQLLVQSENYLPNGVCDAVQNIIRNELYFTKKQCREIEVANKSIGFIIGKNRSNIKRIIQLVKNRFGIRESIYIDPPNSKNNSRIFKVFAYSLDVIDFVINEIRNCEESSKSRDEIKEQKSIDGGLF